MTNDRAAHVPFHRETPNMSVYRTVADTYRRNWIPCPMYATVACSAGRSLLSAVKDLWANYSTITVVIKQTTHILHCGLPPALAYLDQQARVYTPSNINRHYVYVSLISLCSQDPAWPLSRGSWRDEGKYWVFKYALIRRSRH